MGNNEKKFNQDIIWNIQDVGNIIIVKIGELYGRKNLLCLKSESKLKYYSKDITKIPLDALIEIAAERASTVYRKNIKSCTFKNQFEFFTRKGFDKQLATILSNEFLKYVEILKF